MTINIQGTGIELTEAIKAYVEEKIGPVQKFFDNIQQADVDVGRRNNHHQKGDVYYAEVTLHMPGQRVYVQKDADDLYKAIDEVKKDLKVELEKIKGKMRLKDKEGLRGQKEYVPEE